MAEKNVGGGVDHKSERFPAGAVGLFKNRVHGGGGKSNQ